MKHIYIKITILLLVLGSFQSNSQTNSIDFTLTSENIKMVGENVTISSTITKTGDVLSWIQNNNGKTDTTSFVISSSSGNWNQDDSLGSVIYSIAIENFQGSFNLLGEDSGVIGTLSLKVSEAETETYIFNINIITYP